MLYKDIISNLKKKIYSPIYLLMGEESFYIDKISNFISENVLTESEKAFNLTVLYGKDVNAIDVIESAKRFPMSANHQVIIVKEAQKLKDLDKIHYFADNPLKSTLLVLCYKYGKVDKRSKLVKSVQKNGVLFESAKIRDYELPKWIDSYVKDKKYSLSIGCSDLLSNYLGNDLSKIEHEIDKLIFTLPEGVSVIDLNHIEKNIGISKDFNLFELTKVMGMKDFFKANQIIKYMNENPKENPINKAIPVLFTYFLKILRLHYLKDKSKQSVASALKVPEFFANEYMNVARNYPPGKTVKIISMLRDYDLLSKGYKGCTTKSGELMREMVFKIMA